MPTLGSWACEPCVHEKQGPGQAKTVGPDGQGPMVAHAQPQPSRPCAPRRAANCTTGAAPTWAIGHVSPRPGPADASKVHLAWAVLGYTNWASKHAGLAASTSEPTQNPAASGAAGSAAGTATTAMEVGRGMGKAAGKLLRSPHLPAFHVPRSCCLRWLCIELCICCQLYITLCSVACFSLFHAMY